MQVEERDAANARMRKMLQDLFLAGLISNQKHDDTGLALSVLGVQLRLSLSAIALLEPDGCSADPFAKRNRRGELRDLLERHAGEGNLVFSNEEGLICLLFSWKSAGVIERIGRLTSERLPFATTIGVGRPCGLSEMQQSYRQALLCLQHTFYKGIGEIIYYSEIDSAPSVCEYPFAKEKELFDRMKAEGDPMSIRRAVDAFYDYLLRGGPVDKKAVYEMTIRLLVGIEKRTFAELDHENAAKTSGLMAVVTMETLREVKDYVTLYLAGLQELMGRSGKDNHRSIIRKTLQYMEQECRYATLYSVAQKVYMSPTYLSLLVKTNTGKTFIEQLTDIRIAKAKQMLKTSHLKNYEVAEMVGYQDSRYFSQLFKKKVGVSPSEYRELPAGR